MPNVNVICCLSLCLSLLFLVVSAKKTVTPKDCKGKEGTEVAVKGQNAKVICGNRIEVLPDRVPLRCGVMDDEKDKTKPTLEIAIGDNSKGWACIVKENSKCLSIKLVPEISERISKWWSGHDEDDRDEGPVVVYSKCLEDCAGLDADGWIVQSKDMPLVQGSKDMPLDQGSQYMAPLGIYCGQSKLPPVIPVKCLFKPAGTEVTVAAFKSNKKLGPTFLCKFDFSKAKITPIMTA